MTDESTKETDRTDYCDNCGRLAEIQQPRRINDDPLSLCPSCDPETHRSLFIRIVNVLDKLEQEHEIAADLWEDTDDDEMGEYYEGKMDAYSSVLRQFEEIGLTGDSDYIATKDSRRRAIPAIDGDDDDW